MTRSNLSRHIFVLIAAIILLLFPLATVGRVGAQETSDLSTYRAYVDPFDASQTKRIYVYPVDDDSVKTIAYCFNLNKFWPSENENYMLTKDFYLHSDVVGLARFADEGQALKDPETGEPMAQSAFDQAVLSVIVNGYPNNEALQKEYLLSDAEFSMITQTAIYRFSNHGVAGSVIANNWRYQEVYDILIGAKEHELRLPTPADAQINVLQFDPESPLNYQNLITVNFGSMEKPVDLEVTFSKVAAGQGEELEGATLAVTGQDYLETWVSTGVAKQLTLGEGEYTMTEKAAPEGYEIASDIVFRVTAEGTLEIKNEEGAFVPSDEAKIQMVDELSPVTTEETSTEETTSPTTSVEPVPTTSEETTEETSTSETTSSTTSVEPVPTTSVEESSTKESTSEVTTSVEPTSSTSEETTSEESSEESTVETTSSTTSVEPVPTTSVEVTTEETSTEGTTSSTNSVEPVPTTSVEETSTEVTTPSTTSVEPTTSTSEEITTEETSEETSTLETTSSTTSVEPTPTSSEETTLEKTTEETPAPRSSIQVYSVESSTKETTTAKSEEPKSSTKVTTTEPAATSSVTKTTTASESAEPTPTARRVTTPQQPVSGRTVVTSSATPVAGGNSGGGVTPGTTHSGPARVLANTGASVIPIAAVAVLLMGIGGLILVARRNEN